MIDISYFESDNSVELLVKDISLYLDETYIVNSGEAPNQEEAEK